MSQPKPAADKRRLPHFLIVGAMKAGTTTLYRDLCRSPQVFMPEQKEPNTLVRFGEPEAIRADYHDLFPRGSSGRIRGEASTAYTKRPRFDGVAERALAALGPHLKIVYIRREPVRRIVSHYRHDYQLHVIREPFSTALRSHRDLIDWTRYEWQIAPWKAAFGEANVLEIDLDDLSANRRLTVERVLTHIGADPATLPPLDEADVSNPAGDKNPMRSRLLSTVIYSRFYQRRLKPRLPQKLRVAGRRTILPKAEEVSVEVSQADRDYIAEQLGP